MSIRKLVLPVVLLVCVCVATPAYAWFGEGWLESLSGPGPFKGQRYDARLLCLTAPAAAVAGTAIPDTAGGPGWAATFPKDDAARAWFTPLGCHFLDRDQSRLEIGIEYGHLKANENPLDYSNRPSPSTLDTSVKLNMWLATADVRVTRSIDVGVAVGRASFSSPGGVFADFSKTVVQPVRVTLRPLGPVASKSRLAELVSVRVDVTRFSGGFRGEEFGAKPNTFREPSEWVWGMTALIDAGTLFWLR